MRRKHIRDLETARIANTWAVKSKSGNNLD